MPPSSPNPESISHGPELNGSPVSEELVIPPEVLLLDSQLIETLRQGNEHPKYISAVEGLEFENQPLAAMARERYDEPQLEALEKHLKDNDTLNIPMAHGGTVLVDGVPREVTIVPATEIAKDGANHGDMSSMLYLRDQVQAANALMELFLHDGNEYADEGKKAHTLLLSALHLMSTEPQLARMKHVIEVGPAANQEDWPHISLLFDDLEGEGPNGWRNKQDTLQMLAYASLDAIERGLLRVDELAEGHKQFLGSIVPFLESVGYPKYENSGSWEEVTANRTSVMAIETALLGKIQKLSAKEEFGFLRDGSDPEALADLLKKGLTELGKRLPFESADDEYRKNPQARPEDPEAKDSVKYREADAALVYVLMYNLPAMLEEAGIRIGPEAKEMKEAEIENLVLDKLYTLIDDETNGMIRYKGDSYQRVNFHTNAVQKVIKWIKRKVKADADREGKQVDLDEKQALRGQLTPQGREAAWTHPLDQVAAWAAERSMQEENEVKADQYRALSTKFLNRALSTVTGHNQVNAVLGPDDMYHVKQVTPDRLPEALITYQPENGKAFTVPSAHTPLNWSSAMMRQAVGLLRLSTRRSKMRTPELVASH